MAAVPALLPLAEEGIAGCCLMETFPLRYWSKVVAFFAILDELLATLRDYASFASGSYSIFTFFFALLLVIALFG